MECLRQTQAFACNVCSRTGCWNVQKAVSIHLITQLHWSILTVGYHPLCVELPVSTWCYVTSHVMSPSRSSPSVLTYWSGEGLWMRPESNPSVIAKGLQSTREASCCLTSSDGWILNQQVSKVSLTGVRSGALNWKEGFSVTNLKSENFVHTFITFALMMTMQSISH